MTYRDPDDPRTFTNPEVRYRDSADPMRRTYDDPARPRAWNTGSAVGARFLGAQDSPHHGRDPEMGATIRRADVELAIMAFRGPPRRHLVFRSRALA